MVAASEQSYLLSSFSNYSNNFRSLESGVADSNDDDDDDDEGRPTTLQSLTSRKNLTAWTIGLTITVLTGLIFALPPSSSQHSGGLTSKENMMSNSIVHPSNRDYWDSLIHDFERTSYERHQSSLLEQHISAPEHLGGGGHHTKKHHKHPAPPREKIHPKSSSEASSSTSNDPPKVGDEEEEESKLLYFNSSQAFDRIFSPGAGPPPRPPGKKTKAHSRLDDGKSSTTSVATDFFYYQQGWEAQMNQAYCGIASSVAVMNSLRGMIKLPQDSIYEPFPWETQREILNNDCVKTTVLPAFDYNEDNPPRLYSGLGLDMTRTVLSCSLVSQNYTARAIHVDPTVFTVDDIRTIIIDALKDPTARIIMNYDRGGIGQGPMGHGHFSPIGAYNAESDSFLVLDVAKYKYPPVWVPAQNLYNGISTIDHCSEFTYLETRPDGIDFTSILKMMHCQSNYRGLIVVSPSSDEDDNGVTTPVPQE